MNNIEEDFKNWFYDSYGVYSTRAEHFFTDCEVDNADYRKRVILSWLKWAYSQGRLDSLKNL